EEYVPGWENQTNNSRISKPWSLFRAVCLFIAFELVGEEPGGKGVAVQVDAAGEDLALGVALDLNDGSGPGARSVRVHTRNRWPSRNSVRGEPPLGLAGESRPRRHPLPRCPGGGGLRSPRPAGIIRRRPRRRLLPSCDREEGRAPGRCGQAATVEGWA